MFAYLKYDDANFIAFTMNLCYVYLVVRMSSIWLRM